MSPFSRLLIRFSFFILLSCQLAVPFLEGQTEADRKIIDMALVIEEHVSEIRGNPIKRSVEKGIYTRDQLKEFLLKNFDKEMPEEKMAAWEATLKIFGFVPEEMDLHETLMTFLVSQIGGFYDPEEKRLNCLTSKLTFLQRIVMAHEIAHALQDQYMDLVGFYKDVEFNDDLLAARQAVIEGEATRVMNIYPLRYPREMAEDMSELKPMDLGVFMAEQLASVQGAPPYFAESMTFPYMDGEKFIRVALDRGGWKRVDELYRDPPHSSEQILHPEKFFEKTDEPVKITLPSMDEVLGGAWKKITENSAGEYQIRILIKCTADPIRALRASAGWGGDSYAVYRRDDTGDTLMVWALTFDTEKDAVEFIDAEKKGLGRKYKAWGLAEEAEVEMAAGEVAHGDKVKTFKIHQLKARNGATAFFGRRGRDVVVLDSFPDDLDLLTRAFLRALEFEKGTFDFEALKPPPYKDPSSAGIGDGPW